MYFPGAARKAAAENHHRHTGGGHIFLCASINQAVAAYVHGFGENIGTHVAHEGTAPVSGT